jgi:hypothetical protein
MQKEYVSKKQLKLTRPKFISVSIGDTVEIFFRYHRQMAAGPFTCKVRRVNQRRGLTHNGTKQQAPLIDGIDLHSGQERYFDNTYVTRVIAQAKYKAPLTNIFKDWANDRAQLIERRKGYWVGTLESLAALALSTLPYELDRPIDHFRLQALYAKQPIGCKQKRYHGSHFCLYTVDKHRFTNWVRQNHNRICMTVAEVTKMETRMETESESMIEADLDYIVAGMEQENEGTCYDPQDYI